MLTLPHNIIMPGRPDGQNCLRLDMAALPMVSAMEQNGLLIDPSEMASLHKQITGEMGEYEAEVIRLTGHSINLGSGDQLADLLFNKLKLKQQGKEKFTKSKARLAVDADVLKAMISKHSSIKPILEWKVREKLRSSFTFSLLEQADEHGRIHPNLNHTGTETWRYTCTDPNLQTIPQRTKLGRKIRKAFVAGKGLVIGSVDASQIEMRHTAWDTQCPGLMRVFTDSLDLYWTMAEAFYDRVFTPAERTGIDPDTGLPMKDVYRQFSKTMTLGVNYAITPPGLVDQLLVAGAVSFLTYGKSTTWDYDKYYDAAVDRCAAVIRNFFTKYSEVLTGRKRHHREAFRYGMTWDCWGHWRWIAQVKSALKWIVEEGLRAAGNHPIQSGSAGILKLWMACLWDGIVKYWSRFGLKPLLTIHDEILVEGEKSVVEDFLEWAATILAELLPQELYNVPLRASYALAGSWGDIAK